MEFQDLLKKFFLRCEVIIEAEDTALFLKENPYSTIRSVVQGRYYQRETDGPFENSLHHIANGTQTDILEQCPIGMLPITALHRYHCIKIQMKI